MEIFLSWSGDRSRAVAEVFRDWLPKVIQALEPWISPDIGKGERWGGEIANRLEKVRVGILCLTAENLTAPWLLFEAGAISKQKDSRTCTFLLDVKPGDVDQPLGQFQHTVVAKADVLKLVGTLNGDLAKSGGLSLKQEILLASFEKFWPELEAALKTIASKTVAEARGARSSEEKLDEALDLLRGMSRKMSDQQTGAISLDSLLSSPATLAELARGDTTLSGCSPRSFGKRLGESS